MVAIGALKSATVQISRAAPRATDGRGETRVTGAPASGPRHPGTLVRVPRVVVDVVLKPEISDPQGQAVLGALGRLGHDGVRSVRQGKHFVLEVDGTPDRAELERIAETLLANPVIEDVELHLPTD
ncbi:phosphoribosylformylglycinamidine synthase subunit PurS [Geodermatophilus obscurus DSM 43160]